MQIYNPPAPSGILSEDYFQPLGIDPAEFANLIGVEQADIHNLPDGHSAVTADAGGYLREALRYSR